MSPARRFGVALPLLLLTVALLGRGIPAAAAGSAGIRMGEIPELKGQQAARLREGAAEYRARFREAREAAHRRARKTGGGRRPRTLDESALQALGSAPGRSALPTRLEGVTATPPNVRVNDPTGEGSITQAEQHVGFWGSYALSTWNDGLGPNYQGWGVSTDGGATWLDGGTLPIPAPGGTWEGDPVVAVDEKTGTFYVAGLFFPNSNTSAVAVARGRFVTGTFVWELETVVHPVPMATDFIDKEWIAADSLTGNLYLTYTHFTAKDSIVFQRSTDHGATWGPMLTLNSAATAGLVQGSRPAVGPNGEVYVEWYEIGTVDADFWRVAKSTDFGVSFGVPVQAGTGYTNYGTGAPGFNRMSGIEFAGIAVDRSQAATRGRVYVTWPEAVDFYADVIGGSGATAEVEPDNSAATATPFTPGALLHGAYANTSDVDYWSFPATAGKTYIFYCDSSRSSLFSMQVLCSDQVTRLALSGDDYGPDVGTTNLSGLVVWTAPKTATFYLRMAFINLSSSVPHGYHVYTGVHLPIANDRARDARDIAIAGSADGVSFGAPSRSTDDPTGYDDWLPEVAVGSDGMVYTSWYDWRDSPTDCGGSSNTYLTRSTDGGATWAPNVRLTDFASVWSFTGGNLAPNQGDYIGMYGGNAVSVVWADGRSGNPDVYTTGLDAAYSVSCGRDTVGGRGDVLDIPFHLWNHNSQFANAYQMTTVDERGWLAGSPPAVVNAGPGENALAPVHVTVPDTAAGGVNHLMVVWRMADGALPETCSVALTVNAPVGVPAAGGLSFALRGVEPNPAVSRVTVRFVLPVAAPATLEVLDLEGRRVALREVGGLGPGAHAVVLDGDLAGLPAGVYAVRLRQLGRSQTLKLSLMR